MTIVYICSYVHIDIHAYILTCSCYFSAFSQPATGPSSVCEDSDVTLQCGIILSLNDNTTIVRDSVWTRSGVLVTADLPNHRLVFNSTTGRITDLVITNVTLADDNTVYTCTDTSFTIISSVVLNVTGN